MRTRTIVLSATPIVLLALAGGGLVAYDSGRPNTIADGITVGGVDVGGMSRTEAKAKLDQEFVTRLSQPIVVHHDTDTWKLGPKTAQLRADTDEMVDEAVARSGQGNIFQRSWRRATGEEVHADLKPTVHYSGKAVTQLMHDVQVAVNRKPVDATVQLSINGIGHKDSKVGLKVKKGPLRRGIEAALVNPSANHTFVAYTNKTKPKVTSDQLVKTNGYGTILIASSATHTVRIYKDFKLSKTYPIAMGSPVYPTPHGLFKIQNKAVDPVWSVPNSAWAGSLAGQTIPGGAPNNPLKARWLGVTDGVGFHGTSDLGSVGSDASHGCMRMNPVDVIDMYPRVPVGSPVLIA